MRFVILLLAFVLIAPSTWALGYQLFEENGKVGIKNESGQVVLPASFEALGWSDGNFSVVGEVTGYRSKNQWGLLNLKKEFLTSADYDDLVYTGGDRLVASKKLNPFTTKKGCLNLSGKVTVPFRYDGIKVNGLRAIVFVKNGTRFEHGLIDLEDKGILPLKYKSIQSLGSLRYAVQSFDNKIALFTEGGTKLTDFVIDSLSSFNRGWSIIYQGFKQGLLNRDGEVKAEPVYREVKINDDGSVLIRTPDVWMVIDRDNKEQTTIETDDIVADKTFYRIRKSGKYGTLDKQFKSLLPAEYDYLGTFVNNKAAAKKDGKFGVVRADNSIAIPFRFDSLIVEGRLVRVKEKVASTTGWHLYDTLGVEKSQHQYDFIDKYNGKFFPVISHGHYGGIDLFGKEIIHCVYDSLNGKQERVAVKFKSQYGIISLDENWLLTPQSHPLTIVNNELYLEKQPGVTFLKSLSGETIYFTSHSLKLKDNVLIETFSDGAEQQVGLDGRILSPGNVSIDVERVFEESEGMRGVKRDGKFGFIDSKGRLRVANRYENIGSFKEGLASVKILGRWGYVDAMDRIVINPSYEEASDFLHGTAVIKRNGKTGLVDNSGKIVLALRYDQVLRQGDKFILTLNNLKGVADEKGNVLIEPRFDRLEVLPNDQVIVGQSNKYGVLTTHGMSVIPIAYDEIKFISDSGNYLALKKSEWKNFN